METTMTSSQSLVIPEAQFNAFLDELQKIAEVKKSPNQGKLKKWLRATAVMSAGYGVGHGTAYALDRFISKELNRIPATTRHKLLGPAAGIMGAASAYALKKRYEHYKKVQE